MPFLDLLRLCVEALFGLLRALGTSQRPLCGCLQASEGLERPLKDCQPEGGWLCNLFGDRSGAARHVLRRSLSFRRTPGGTQNLSAGFERNFR